ncbi:MAG: hypothetical protein V4513_08010 [Pseudomonadota bacterium]
MTTLASWVSEDDKGPSAIYVAADSRITWGSDARRWDSGRKVFPASSPDVFGYSGDVLFPSLVLGQLTDLIDRKLVWGPHATSEDRHAAVVTFLKTAFQRRHRTPNTDFTIFHCSRDGRGVGSVFHFWRVEYSARKNDWSDSRIDVHKTGKSRRLFSSGSGRTAFEDAAAQWDRSPQGGTARAVFSALCEAIESGADPLSGGVPQIVALDRNSRGKLVGFVADGTRYLYGLPIPWTQELAKLEWVDRLFQRMSPETLQLLSGAQRHAKVVEPKSDGLKNFLRRSSEVRNVTASEKSNMPMPPRNIIPRRL